MRPRRETDRDHRLGRGPLDPSGAAPLERALLGAIVTVGDLAYSLSRGCACCPEDEHEAECRADAFGVAARDVARFDLDAQAALLLAAEAMRETLTTSPRTERDA